MLTAINYLFLVINLICLFLMIGFFVKNGDLSAMAVAGLNLSAAILNIIAINNDNKN